MKLAAKIAVAIIAVLCAPLAAFYIAPEPATRWELSLERARAGLVRREVTLPTGLHYVYLEGGKGETLMLLHGFGGDKDNFTRVAAHLTDHYHLIIPDHIGFGESDHPAHENYAAMAQADRLHALAKELGLGKLHLGGNSMGGQISIAYAARYPGEVQSLWLIDPAGIWSAPKSELAHLILEKGKNPLIPHTEDEFAQEFAFVMNDPPFIPRPMLNVLAQASIHNLPLADNIFLQTVSDSIEDRANGMPIPSLIVWGDHDRAINVEAAHILHRLMPQSQVKIMAGLGHVPMIENPGQCAEDYLDFRKKLAH